MKFDKKIKKLNSFLEIIFPSEDIKFFALMWVFVIVYTLICK